MRSDSSPCAWRPRLARQSLLFAAGVCSTRQRRIEQQSAPGQRLEPEAACCASGASAPRRTANYPSRTGTRSGANAARRAHRPARERKTLGRGQIPVVRTAICRSLFDAARRPTPPDLTPQADFRLSARTHISRPESGAARGIAAVRAGRPRGSPSRDTPRLVSRKFAVSTRRTSACIQDGMQLQSFAFATGNSRIRHRVSDTCLGLRRFCMAARAGRLLISSQEAALRAAA